MFSRLTKDLPQGHTITLGSGLCVKDLLLHVKNATGLVAHCVLSQFFHHFLLITLMSESDQKQKKQVWPVLCLTANQLARLPGVLSRRLSLAGPFQQEILSTVWKSLKKLMDS